MVPEAKKPTRNEEAEPEAARFVSADAIDVAFNWQTLSFTMQLGALWVVGSTIFIVATDGLADATASSYVSFLGPVLAVIWAAACLQLLTGGVARLTTLQLEGQRFLRSDAWGFIRRRWLSLIFGNVVLLVGLSIVTGLGSALVRLITRIPYLGEILGAVSIVPTFLLLLSISVGLNSYLLPCIMGCEDTDIGQTLRYLVRFSKKPTRLLSAAQEYYETIFSVFPLAVATGIVGAATLFPTYLICASGSVQNILSQESSNVVANFLQMVSVGGIIYAWIAYLIVYLISSFTIIYYNESR